MNASSDNMDDYSMWSRSSVPGSMLPNPGEGGPVAAPGGGIPGSLLPNPGEGGPVFPGGANTPGNMLPNPGEGGPVFPGGENVPVIPLPNPGEGGPVARGDTFPVFPQPNPPCFFCNTGKRNGQVRFLNAAYGYRPFRVYINTRYIAGGLGFASLTPYGRVASGFQTITVTGSNGYVYLQKSMPFRSDDASTIAIINSASGLDLMQISDSPCLKLPGMSCFRVCNLAYSSNPLDILLADGRVVYSDVRFKEVTSFKRVRRGSYEFYITETSLRPTPRFEDIETLSSNIATLEMPEVLVSFYVDVRPNAMYTVYILSRDSSPEALQTMVVEDR